MLYRFKSQASADVVMLSDHARPLLEIIGKAPAASGIITVDQMPAAIAALQAAVANEAQQGRHNHDPHVSEDHDTEAEVQHVGLHQRAAPLIKMMRESSAEQRDIVWGH